MFVKKFLMPFKNNPFKMALCCMLSMAMAFTAFISLGVDVSAATFNVDTFDELSLACETGGTVVVTSSVSVSETISIPKGVTVYLTCNHSAGSTSTDIYRAKGFHGHLFKVADGATLYVRCAIDGNNKDGNGNLRGTGATGTESDGYYGQALILNYGNVILDNDKSVLKNNYNAYNNDYKSGALWTYNGTKYYGLSASPTSTSLSGSAVLCVNGKLTMSNGQIYGCYSDNGPAFYVCNGYAGDVIKISGGKIHDNVARRYGGAIFAASRKPYSDYSDSSSFVGSRTLNSTGSNALVTISGGKIYNNLARLNSGAVWVGFGGTFYMSGGSVYSNVATEEGGGAIRVNAGGSGTTGGWMCFANPGGQAWIAGGSIYSNSCATNGGAITVPNNSDANNLLKITGGSIYSNTAGASGGGVYVGSELTMSGGSVYKNSADSSGAGIYLTSTAYGKISGGSVYSNSATSVGGGVCSYGSLDVSGGYYYGNTNWGVAFMGADNSVSGGRFGVSAYENYSSYTVSRNTKGQIYVGSSGKLDIVGGTSRVVSALVDDEGVGTNIAVRNDGTLTVASSCNADNGYMDIYGTGSGIYNTGTLKIAGKMNIMTSKQDGLGVQNRRGIYNSGSATVTGDLSVRFCGLRALYNSGTFTMSAGNMYGNEASGAGGAIYNLGTFKITGGSIYNNTTASNGGAIYNISSDDSAGKFTMTGGEIYSNTASSHGGGVYLTTAGQASSISGGKIYSNTATKYGGGICSYRENGLTISGTANVYSNSGTHGGGVFNSTGPLTFSGTIASNSATYGGGVYLGSTISITGGKIDDNTASQKGGGIYSATDTTVKMTAGAITNNYAKYYGGGAHSSGTLTMSGSATFSGNTTEQYGGAIHNNSGTLNLNGGSITNNGSNSVGGGVCSFGTAKIAGVSITNNTSIVGGGFFQDNNGVTTMSSGSISNNTADNYGGGVSIDTGSFTLSGGSISSNSTKSFLSGGGGVHNNGAFIMTGGSIHSNTLPLSEAFTDGVVAETEGGGISSGADGTSLDIRGGSIYNNTACDGGGIYAFGGDINISGGSIYGNNAEYRGGGIYSNIAKLNLTGGTVYDNTSPKGSGVYNSSISTINMSKSFRVKDGNDTYLGGKTYITVPTGFSYDGLVTKINCDHRDIGRIVAKSEYSNKLGSELLYYEDINQRFELTFDKTTAGTKAFLRGGDQGASSYPESGISDEDVFISAVYSVSFDGNLSGHTVSVPADVAKYWYEDLVNVPLADATIESEDYRFIGWNTTRAGLGEDYFSPLNFTGNESIILYAQWENLNEEIKEPVFFRIVRFISKKYYKNSDGTYVSSSAGGLNYGSIWMNNNEYEELLSKALNNVQDTETGAWNTVYQTWTITKETVSEMKEYIADHGLGNSKESDALAKFYELYKPE